MYRELLLITIYCVVDDFCRQLEIMYQLKRPVNKLKLSDVALLSLALLQEFTGITDEDDYWHYVCKRFDTYIPGQLVDRSQFHGRKRDLSPLVNTFRAQLVRKFPVKADHHIIDYIGTSALTVTKFFGSQRFPNAGIGYCASK